jgi:hypothetical protein
MYEPAYLDSDPARIIPTAGIANREAAEPPALDEPPDARDESGEAVILRRLQSLGYIE